jgi:hypothetical protein
MQSPEFKTQSHQKKKKNKTKKQKYVISLRFLAVQEA